jgi:predicted lipoprotein
MIVSISRLVRSGLCITALVLVTACGGDSADVIINNPGPDDGPDPTPSGFDASGLITDIGEDVIVGTYGGMADATGDLLDAVTVLADGNLSRANLEAAQNAWYEARKYWESSEGFLWGPIDTEGYDPKLDDWPVNKVDLDNILADANVDLGNQGVIDQLETTVKGFHTIEYLLFNDGTGNEDTSGCGVAAAGTQACYDNILAALADPRRIEYLVGISINIDTVANQTLDAWMESGGDFLSDVVSAGKGSAIYPSQKAVLEEVVQGAIGIADEVSAGKLGDPFAAGDPLTVESKFSGNSLTDFQYNIRSIRNLYCGRKSIGTESAVNACSASGNSGLAELVMETDSDLHAQMLQAIDKAVSSIADIPGPYEQAVEAAKTDAVLAQSIQGAIDAVQELMELMQGELLPLLDEVDFAF